jgi:hypothetical protein
VPANWPKPFRCRGPPCRHISTPCGRRLVSTEKAGKSVIYHLNVSVLEEALLGFAGAFGLGSRPAPDASSERKE